MARQLLGNSLHFQPFFFEPVMLFLIFVVPSLRVICSYKIKLGQITFQTGLLNGSSSTASPNSSASSTASLYNTSASEGQGQSNSVTSTPLFSKKSIFLSPFLRRKQKSNSKISKLEERLLEPLDTKPSTDEGVTIQQAGNGDANPGFTREELLRLFLLKLDEEANYFQVGPASPEDDLCECQKCQVTKYTGRQTAQSATNVLLKWVSGTKKLFHDFCLLKTQKKFEHKKESLNLSSNNLDKWYSYSAINGKRK